MITRIIVCYQTVYKNRIRKRYRFAAPKDRFSTAKGYVRGDETWSLGRSTLIFRIAKDKQWRKEELGRRKLFLVFTDFNFYFITFPRQVFVNIFDKYSDEA